MTPEERAKAFVAEHRGFDLDGNCWFIACDRAEANLAQALRQAENEKLEEAAAVAAGMVLKAIDDGSPRGQVAAGVAFAVRSLKSKD